MKIKCSHPIMPEIEFLLKSTGQNYQSRVIGPFGNPIDITLMDKWLYHRDCKENTLARNEVYEMFVKLGEYFPGKRTDDLF